MIDLHLHTTASDGLLSPEELVSRAADAGITILAVTDHDTLDGVAAARAAAETRGVRLIPGIEITAVEQERDVHVLGYFVDLHSRPLNGFLAGQRADRVRRVTEIASRLAELGAPIELDPLLRSARTQGRSVGRPHVAAALMAAGHVATREEAFERFLGRDRPAFIARRGPAAAEVVRVIAVAGGLSALAHPGPTHNDALIPTLAAAGLDALEARHSDHDAAAEQHYRGLAAVYGLAVSGGSDFHGDEGGHVVGLGSVTLPQDDFDALEARRR